MSTKIETFKSVFTSPYSLQNYQTFVKEFFNNVSWVSTEQRKDYWNWSEFSVFIEGYTHLATYIGTDENKVAIFSVELKKGQNIDRARSAQRNFVKKLIESGGTQAALVAFYSAEETKKWRLSFVKLDYEFSTGKIKQKITPAKRYSYLVGEGEPSHTAQERLYTIFTNETDNPTLAEMEDAFSVEKITKEFFEQYKEKYFELKEHLDGNSDFNEEAKRHDFSSEQFAKKLMGQIAFLYFVQKKGWLGVNALPKNMTEKEFKEAYYTPAASRRDIITRAYRKFSENEYRLVVSEVEKFTADEDEILAKSVKGSPWGTGPRNFMRKLFNDSVKNGKNYFDEYLEPLFYEALNVSRGDIGYYSRLHCRVPFLNGGLFEPLDNYNWEDNKFGIPNDIFSNRDTKDEYSADGILDVFDRFNFTMNEDEPLEKEVAVDPEMLGKIFENLLDTKDRKSKGAFYTPREIVHYMCQESLINYIVNETNLQYDDIKDFIVYGEFMKDEDTTRGVKQGISEMHISQNLFDISKGVNRLIDIDNALANIRVCDPAVGSGAFPLGMINEIVKARSNITAYFALEKKNAYEIKVMYQGSRHPYRLKYNTIKNCIYAVDIEPSAIDITKLRLWLSLVVDEETDANAESMSLFVATKNPKPLPNLDCNIRCGNSLINELCGVKLINESDLLGNAGEAMQTYMGQNVYEELLKQLFEAQDKLFNEKNHDTKEELKAKINTVIDQVVSLNIKDAKSEVKKVYEKTKHSPSLPYFLWHLEFARVFKDKGGFDVVIGNPPYISAVVNSKGENPDREIIRKKYSELTGAFDLYTAFLLEGFNLLNKNGCYSWIIPNKFLVSQYSQKTLEKLKSTGLRYSISVSHIEVFENVSVYPIILIGNKSMPGFQELTAESLQELGNRKFITKARMRQHKTFKDANIKFGSGATGFQAQQLKEYISDIYCENSMPFIVSGSVDRFVLHYDNVRYMGNKYKRPFITKGKDIADSKWRFWENEKIIIAGMTKVIEAVYCSSPIAMGVGIYAIYDFQKNDPKFLTCLLNSKYLSYYLNSEFKEKHLAGGYLAINKTTLELLPFVDVEIEIQTRIAEIYDKLSALLNDDPSADTSSHETQIDQMVYELYGLTEEEIKKVEENFK